MKHKIVYIVLFVVTMQLPVSSNECGKSTQAVITENPVDATFNADAVVVEDTGMLPVSPISRLLFNL